MKGGQELNGVTISYDLIHEITVSSYTLNNNFLQVFWNMILFLAPLGITLQSSTPSVSDSSPFLDKIMHIKKF